MRRIALALVLLAGCGGLAEHEREVTVSGTASWPASVTLGPRARFLVFLADASGPEPPLEVALQKLDNPEPGAELLAYDTDEGELRPPHAFALPVPAEKVDSGHRYRLSIVVVDDGRPVLALAERPLVLTRGHPRRVDVALTPVAR